MSDFGEFVDYFGNYLLFYLDGKYLIVDDETEKVVKKFDNADEVLSWLGNKFGVHEADSRSIFHITSKDLGRETYLDPKFANVGAPGMGVRTLCFGSSVDNCIRYAGWRESEGNRHYIYTNIDPAVVYSPTLAKNEFRSIKPVKVNRIGKAIVERFDRDNPIYEVESEEDN